MSSQPAATFSVKVNALIVLAAFLPLVVIVFDADALPHAVVTATPWMVLLVFLVTFALGYSAGRQIERTRPEELTVNKSILVIILLSLIAVTAVMLPQHVQNRESLRSQTGVFQGIEAVRKHQLAVIEVEGTRQTYLVWGPLTRRLRTVAPGANVEFRSDRHDVIAEFSVNGSQLLTYDQYAAEIRGRGPGIAVLILLAACAYAWLGSRPLRFWL